MVQRTITYNAWDHNEQVVPANLKPRVGFRPLATSLANGMMTHREVWGSLDPATGAGTVTLEYQPGILYVPFMDWLLDPSMESEQVQNRARRQCEWAAISPSRNGPIDELPEVVQMRGFYYGFGDPPEFLRARNDVIYIDISGADDGYWQPWVPEGTYVEGGA